MNAIDKNMGNKVPFWDGGKKEPKVNWGIGKSTLKINILLCF